MSASAVQQNHAIPSALPSSSASSASSAPRVKHEDTFSFKVLNSLITKTIASLPIVGSAVREMAYLSLDKMTATQIENCGDISSQLHHAKNAYLMTDIIDRIFYIALVSRVCLMGFPSAGLVVPMIGSVFALSNVYAINRLNAFIEQHTAAYEQKIRGITPSQLDSAAPFYEKDAFRFRVINHKAFKILACLPVVGSAVREYAYKSLDEMHTNSQKSTAAGPKAATKLINKAKNDYQLTDIIDRIVHVVLLTGLVAGLLKSEGQARYTIFLISCSILSNSLAANRIYNEWKQDVSPSLAQSPRFSY